MFINDLIRAGQLEFKTEKLLNGSHGDPAGAADEPLHQILVGRQTDPGVSPPARRQGAPLCLNQHSPSPCSHRTAPCCAGSPDRWLSEGRSCGSLRVCRRHRQPRRRRHQVDTAGSLLGQRRGLGFEKSGGSQKSPPPPTSC